MFRASLRVMVLLVLLNGGLFAALVEHGAIRLGGPRWYRGNLHTHTRYSDGHALPEAVIEWYQARGYDFLALTDHDRLPVPRDARDFGLTPFPDLERRFSRAGHFLLLQGEEISGVTGANQAVHLNAYPLRRPIQGRGRGPAWEAIRDAIREVERTHQEEVAVHLNHPTMDWAVSPEDMLKVPELRLFEVYNGITADMAESTRDEKHLSPDQMWDRVLATRYAQPPIRPLFGLATDDTHRLEVAGPAAPGRGWVMVRAQSLTAVDIVSALRRGDFYASSGVTLYDVEETANGLSMAIEPEPGVTYDTTFYGTRVGGAPGEALARVQGTEPSYRFFGDELYVRARVVSSREHRVPFHRGELEKAWTQPVVGPKAPRPVTL